MLLLDRYRQHAVFGSPLLPAVVRAILRSGPISRAQIARQAHLSKQTSSELVSALEDLGWVRKTGKISGEVGRRAEGYEFDPNSAYVLGIDVGGTKLHVALADHSGSIIAERVVPTDERGGMDLASQIGAVSDQVIASVPVDRNRLLCAAIGIPGTVEVETGRIFMAPNIPLLDEFDVVSAFRNALGGLHVLVENDVNLAAVGESWNGLSDSCDDIVFISLGTGIGMGVVSEGRLLRGRSGAAGEISYLPIGADPFDPKNRRNGPLEAAVGSDGITRRYQEAGGAAGVSVRAMFDAFSIDPIARQVFDGIARDLALAVLTVVALIDPSRIVFGGSIGVRRELLELVESYLPQLMDRVPEVSTSRFGSRATTMGAIAIALDEVHRNLFGVHSLSPGLMTKTVAKTVASTRTNDNLGGSQTRSLS